MAKSKSILELQGTIGNLTYVDSKAYEPHVRKARSSGEVNGVFKENNKQISGANKPAQLIKNVVDIYRENFPGGQLWQRLVSHFKRQTKENRPFSATGMAGMEINENYKLDRLLTGNSSVAVDSDEKSLRFAFSYNSQPDFKRKYPDAYALTGIAIFPDFEAEKVNHTAACSDIINLNSNCEPLLFTFPIPEQAIQYLICLKLEGYEKGKICEGFSTIGMKIMTAADII